MAVAMVALVAMASMETSAPRSPLFSASRHLAGLVWHGLLAEHQAARGGEGRDKVERGAAVGAVVAAARGLSIDGDELRAFGPSLAHPSGEGGREQGRVDTVHQNGQPAPAGDAVLVGQMASQEVQVGVAPRGNMVVVVAVGDGAADHQEQDLGQRVGNATDVARVVDGGEVVQQCAEAGFLRRKARGH
jgi:hypothetical protein